MGLHSCIMKPLLLWAHPPPSVSCHRNTITQPPLPLSLPPSLSPLSGVLSNRWVHPHCFQYPSLPLALSHSITLMCCGSVRCGVCAYMGVRDNLLADILSISLFFVLAFIHSFPALIVIQMQRKVKISFVWRLFVLKKCCATVQKSQFCTEGELQAP